MRRRQTTKFNGASYLTQCAARALYSPEGQRQVKETVDYYMENASIMRRSLTEAGYEVAGGVNSPYLWIKAPDGMTSWEFFDLLLENTTSPAPPAAASGRPARAI